jgi:pyruvate dehydrogenase E2 component (dihydrolipoamide acetyltransferase)
MAAEVKLPRLGQGMESGTIVKWLKAEGDRVEKGEPLYELDTEKVTQEVEADVAGVLLRIAVSEGEVPVGQTIAFVGEKDEEIGPESADSGPAGPEPGPQPESEGQVAVAAAQLPTPTDGRVKASPLARRIARERGVDLAVLSGTGPEGRIVAEDVERAAAPPRPAAPAAPTPLPGEVEQVPLTSVRRTIARRLTEAWQVPVFQLQVSADMERVGELLARRKELDPEARVTVTDVLTKICAHALMRHPDVNVQFTEEALLRFPTANVALAVAAPQGLVVPVIKNAERLSLAEISFARADLVERARAGGLRREDLEGGTFTISNLGMFGVERFAAVLNPPQAAILAVGATEERPVVLVGQVTVRPTMAMTLTVDHRAVDGAPAAEFLATVKTLLEEPSLAL